MACKVKIKVKERCVLSFHFITFFCCYDAKVTFFFLTGKKFAVKFIFLLWICIC